VAYKSAPGPYGFKPAEMAETLGRVVGRPPGSAKGEATD
jgi:hypothetical protein